MGAMGVFGVIECGARPDDAIANGCLGPVLADTGLLVKNKARDRLVSVMGGKITFSASCIGLVPTSGLMLK